MKKSYNYKAVFISRNEKPKILFAVSKVVLFLEKLNTKLNKEAVIVATAIDSSDLLQDTKSISELFLQINLINKTSVETVVMEINKLLDIVKYHYNLEQVKFELIEE